jgi:hypothetical protein
MDSEPTKPAAPYLPFATFLTALDHLKAIGVPNKIDRAVFPSFNGTMQKQLLNSFQFLGLIDAAGTPLPGLTMLTDGAKDRKEGIKNMLQRNYPEIVSLDLTKVSPSQFDQKLGEYNVSGDTFRKAKSFFLKAAQFSDLPLSPLLTRKTRNPSNGKRKRPHEQAAKAQAQPRTIKPDHPSTGTTKTIRLKSGGELNLSLSVDLFALTGADREFVFELVDKIQNYEGNNEDR